MIGFGRMMVKDAKVILRHRLLLIILLLYPFVFMAIIGLTFSENREMRLGVVYEEAAGAPVEGAKIWIEGEPYDNRGLVERFLGEIASIEEYPDSAKAEDALRAGQKTVEAATAAAAGGGLR